MLDGSSDYNPNEMSSPSLSQGSAAEIAADAPRGKATLAQAMMRILRGIAAGIRSRPGVFAVATVGVLSLDLLLPIAVLSITRKPFDYFTFNPWLSQFPEYIAGATPWQEKLAFLPNLALFWFSADSPFGGVDWGFAVTVSDLLRILLLALLFGAYFALVFYCRGRSGDSDWRGRLSRGGGASGALASVLGISTGGCTVMGCGAPVLPVIGLAFAGLSSGALIVLAELSRVATIVVFIAVAVGVLYLGRIAGGETPQRGH